MTAGWVVAALAYTLIVGLTVGSVAAATVFRRRQRKVNADAHAHFLSVAADYQREIDQLRAGAAR